jgi:hypothetical protein
MAGVLGPNYTRLTASQMVANETVLFWGAVILTSVTGGDATIYDGRDATSGEQLMRLEGIANQSTPVIFPFPLPLGRGLYVAVGSNVTEVTVFWERPSKTD